MVNMLNIMAAKHQHDSMLTLAFSIASQSLVSVSEMILWKTAAWYSVYCSRADFIKAAAPG